MPSRRSAGGRRTTALLAALVTLPALVACSAPSEVVPVAAVSARHAAPADLAVTTEGDALVATWAAPATATSMDVTGYELYVDDAAVVALDAGTTSHRLAGVRPGGAGSNGHGHHRSGARADGNPGGGESGREQERH